MFGMNEGDTATFWIALIIASAWLIREVVAHVCSVREERWAAEKAKYTRPVVGCGWSADLGEDADTDAQPTAERSL